MQRFDVLIVGGGPAGSSCAWALRRAGMNVAVIDQVDFPRDKVCAGWITPAVLHALEIDPGEYAEERVLQDIRGFRVGLIGSKKQLRGADIPYSGTVGYGIRRREFDDYLLRRSGARLFTGVALAAPRKNGREWVINDQFTTPMLVGAAGHACPVARMLGAHPAGESAVLTKEIEFLLPESERAACAVHGERPELYFSPDLAGYGWCFRKGDYLNIGLGRADRWELTRHVEEFVTLLQRSRGIPKPPRHLNGHAYLLYGQAKRNRLAEAVLLVGDAAGLASPHSGEGIFPAVQSGLLAAQTILEAHGDYSRLKLEPYLGRLRRQFGSDASLKARLSEVVPQWARAPLARSLFRFPGLVRRVVLNQSFLNA